METQADKLNRLSAVVSLVAKIYASKSGFMTEAEHHLLIQSQAAAMPQKGLPFNEALKMYHDVIFLASQAYKDRPTEDLSKDERQLVAELQRGQFLTKNAEGQDDSYFGFGFHTNLNDRGLVDDLKLDPEQAKYLAGANWHTMTATETTEAIVLQTKGLLGPHVRETGGDNGHLRCRVGPYIGQQ